MYIITTQMGCYNTEYNNNQALVSRNLGSAMEPQPNGQG